MNEQKLKEAFAEALDIPVSSVNDTLEYNVLPQWDSVAHMALIASIERAFDILIETEDVIALSSYGKCKQILAKYAVTF